MKQLGNLSIICARRSDLCLNITNGTATVFVGSGPDRNCLEAKWDDDDAISKIIYELNFGEYRAKRTLHAEASCALLPVFILIESYGGILQEAYPYMHSDDAIKHWEKATGLLWSENEAYDAEPHDKEEYSIFETVLFPEFEEDVCE